MISILLFIIGLYLLLDNHIFGVAIIGMSLNLFVLSMATVGHPLMQSLVLTAVVISTGTISMWYHQQQ